MLVESNSNTMKISWKCVRDIGIAFLILYLSTKYILLQIQLNSQGYKPEERFSQPNISSYYAVGSDLKSQQYDPRVFPLYEKEAIILEGMFRKRVSSFYEKYKQYYERINKKIRGFKKVTLQKMEYQICSKPIDLLIMVNSSPLNVKRRLAIRYSWGERVIKLKSTREQSRVLFFIGRSTDLEIQGKVEEEAMEFQDIISLDLIDDYKTLSAKVMETFHWVYGNCKTYFILKTDDDCFVNKDNLLEFLQRQGVRETLYTGRVQWAMPAIRDPSSKFYVPKTTYEPVFLHPYVSGGGYVLSANLLKPILKSDRKSGKRLPIEDANIGNLMHNINIKPSDNRNFLPFIYCNISVWDRPPCDYVEPYVIHGVDEYGQLWLHYHIKIMTHVPSICKHSKKHRHKFQPPTYCPVDLSL
eukprot:TCONS_00024840-protein